MSTQHTPPSLLSLSIAAANVAPLTPAADPRPANTTKHRRLSSAGRSRRRLSDARDAATRPFPASLQSASASLAALSLSSPTVSHRAQPSLRESSDLDDDTSLSASPPQAHTSIRSSGRKRGTIFTCESCSKVYRHPSCLIKHRWEHTPQWREASKFVLSKHQQVQLLEAAAILSHLSPSSASLPEDRSLWPSFLSGGLVPLPASMQNQDLMPEPIATASPLMSASTIHPISMSVPAHTTMGGIHDPPTTEDDALNLLALRSGDRSTSPSTSVPTSHPPLHPRARARPSHSHSLSLSLIEPSLSSRTRERRRSNAYEYGAFVPGLGYDRPGWALPRSSVRSKSGSSASGSGSQSASESRSDDEREDEGEGVPRGVAVRVGGADEMGVYRSHPWKTEDDVVDKGVRVEHTWDGMEMEMEMD